MKNNKWNGTGGHVKQTVVNQWHSLWNEINKWINGDDVWNDRPGNGSQTEHRFNVLTCAMYAYYAVYAYS